GINDSRLVSAKALANTHRSLLDQRSYQMKLLVNNTDAVRSPTPAWNWTKQTATVHHKQAYLFTVQGLQEKNNSAKKIDYVIYADGSNRYYRFKNDSGIHYAKEPIELSGRVSPFLAEQQPFVITGIRYIREYLSIEGLNYVSTVNRNGTTLYQVTKILAEPRGYRHRIRVTALVTPTGFVEELRVDVESRYSDVESNIVVLKYKKKNITEIKPPTWYSKLN
ncbi:MAG: hypothetical protein ABEI13_00600, partial [Candidatus Paceibacteria bacterium]